MVSRSAPATGDEHILQRRKPKKHQNFFGWRRRSINTADAAHGPQEEHGRVEESTRQNLIMAFNNVLRTSTLVGVVDFQRAALAFGALLERSADSGVIELGPLYDFLIEQGAPQAGVIEVIIFMKSRESRFGMAMTLPPQLSTFTQDDIDNVVLTFTSRGATSGTRAGQTPQAGAGRTQPPISQPTSSSSSSGFVPEAAEATPASRQRRMLVALVLISILGVASFVYNTVTALPPPEPITVADPSGLPCVNPIATAGNVICRMPKAVFEAEASEAIDARGAVTKAAVAAKGYTRVLVYTAEDNKLRKVF